MEAYLLYRKDQRSALVFKDMTDDEISYILGKLERSRVKWLKQFAKELLADFQQKSNGVEEEPPVHVVQTDLPETH